ncbi:hypothetical protein N658DRAFT_188314 [Parathielavia hyrcaniae]|uniref:Uncharacterized protein n=1 Tax=Parathielavia hyrcaniae TaxID=113614 RepID=A0AAN6T4R7_9PEZI|nr:hypothetical protein N658DRAFT_188314 [Parathielavia hyrcaniae]
MAIPPLGGRGKPRPSQNGNRAPHLHATGITESSVRTCLGPAQGPVPRRPPGGLAPIARSFPTSLKRERIGSWSSWWHHCLRGRFIPCSIHVPSVAFPWIQVPRLRPAAAINVRQCEKVIGDRHTRPAKDRPAAALLQAPSSPDPPSPVRGR